MEDAGGPVSSRASMKLKIAILAAAAATLFAGSVQAAFIGYGIAPYTAPVVVDPLVQPARIVCNAWGRCWRTRPLVYAAPVVVYPRRHVHGYGSGPYGRG